MASLEALEAFYNTRQIDCLIYLFEINKRQEHEDLPGRWI
jgi:hypothetical protein